MELTEREDVKRANPLIDVVRGYGIRVDNHNKCLCPFHNDKNASMQIFKDNKYKCWSCGAYGDVFDFVMRYNNCDFKTAFALLGGSDKRMTPDEKRAMAIQKAEQERQRKLKEDFDIDIHNLNLKINTLYRVAIWLGRDVEDFDDEHWDALEWVENKKMEYFTAIESRKEQYDRDRSNDTTRTAFR